MGFSDSSQLIDESFQSVAKNCLSFLIRSRHQYYFFFLDLPDNFPGHLHEFGEGDPPVDQLDVLLDHGNLVLQFWLPVGIDSE